MRLHQGDEDPRQPLGELPHHPAGSAHLMAVVSRILRYWQLHTIRIEGDFRRVHYTVHQHPILEWERANRVLYGLDDRLEWTVAVQFARRPSYEHYREIELGASINATNTERKVPCQIN